MISSANRLKRVSLEDIKETVDNMDVFKSAQGNLSVTISYNGFDTECYIIAKNGKILRHDTILGEDMEILPSASQYAHLYEAYPDLNYLEALCKQWSSD